MGGFTESFLGSLSTGLNDKAESRRKSESTVIDRLLASGDFDVRRSEKGAKLGEDDLSFKSLPGLTISRRAEEVDPGPVNERTKRLLDLGKLLVTKKVGSKGFLGLGSEKSIGSSKEIEQVLGEIVNALADPSLASEQSKLGEPPKKLRKLHLNSCYR